MIEMCSVQLCQYIEAATHFILNKRQLYPEAIFVSRLAFGVPVKTSIHPDVNKYIEESLDCLMSALDSRDSQIVGFDLVVLDQDEDLVEKYAFGFGNIRIKPKGKNVVADKHLRPVDAAPETVQLIRTSLLKLCSRMADLPPLDNNKECTFNFQIHTNILATV